MGVKLAEGFEGGLHFARACFDWRCPVRRVSRVFSTLCRAPNSHELCTHLHQALWVSNSSGSTPGLFERPDHLTKIDTLRHCCDQQRTSSLTQTQRLLQHHAGCRFCGGSATESAHDGTIQMATTTWPVDGGNLSGFRVR